MKKLTQEYAKELAKEKFPTTGITIIDSVLESSQVSYTKGYLKAIKETKVKELIESLKVSVRLLNQVREDDEHRSVVNKSFTESDLHRIESIGIITKNLEE